MATPLRPHMNATFYPGTGAPADEVVLQPTDITPYLMNPEIAQLEAEVTKARYGGKSIQEDPNSPLYQQPPAEMQPMSMPPGGYNRGNFESSVFKQLGGNPFEIDVMQQVEAATNQQLPALFQQVFGNQVIWQDRNKLDAKQASHWNSEIQKFRAYLKDQIESDKKTKIDTYNNLMKRFDNESKEHEAAMKKVRQQQKDILGERKAATQEHTALRKEKTSLLKRLTELATNEYPGVDQQTSTEQMTEITDIQNRIKEINGILYSKERRISQENEAKRLAQKGKSTAKKELTDDEIQQRYNELRKTMTPAEAKEALAKEGINIT